jgi:PAS domain-containing protein
MSALIPNAAYILFLAGLCLAIAFAAIWLVSRLDKSKSPGRAFVDNSQHAPEEALATDNVDPAISRAPYPIWITDKNGRVIRANPAYLAYAKKLPDQRHLDEKDLPTLFRREESEASTDTPYRASLHLEGNDSPLWFDVAVTDLNKTRIHYATDANAVVKAEIAQRNFVQTLTKTFAQLSIGLAIFDRNRQLALFNPALIDLTALPADFLSARPNLQTFFDRMRENRMIPEPKNYTSWREQIADLVIAASDGRFSETWTLPSGLTYRVTGRPHPDGAVAFLFEDISAEISLTRRFRAELELGQSVMDTLDEAICVFSTTGVLTFSNSAYRSLWNMDPDAAFAEVTVRDASHHWQERCPADAVWARVRDFVVDFGVREPWQDQVRTLDGQNLIVAAAPISGGATLVTFSSVALSGIGTNRHATGTAGRRT